MDALFIKLYCITLEIFFHSVQTTKLGSKIIQKVLLTEFKNANNITENQLWDISTQIKQKDIQQSQNAIPFFSHS